MHQRRSSIEHCAAANLWAVGRAVFGAETVPCEAWSKKTCARRCRMAAQGRRHALKRRARRESDPSLAVLVARRPLGRLLQGALEAVAHAVAA